MQSEARELPAETVAASAQIMAGRWMGIALVPAIVTTVFALTMIAVQFSPHRLEHNHTVGGVIFAGVVVVGLPGSLVIWFLARARHYAGLAKIASADKTLTWHLAGKSIAATLDGAPRPELVFSVTRALRRTLTVVPRATLVQ